MMGKITLLFGCLLVALSYVTEAKLTIGSFNIQRMSDNKVSNTTVLRRIAQILVRFDIVAVQEVMHDSAMHDVLVELNRIGGPYSTTLSPQLGRTSYKEYLAIIYRSDKVSLRQTETYPDHNDDFEREPYSALFHTTQSSVTNFGIMGVHIKPADVREEMNEMIGAYEHAAKTFGTQDFIMMGDFNADCRYLSGVGYTHTDLYTDDRFEFLVDKTADTTANHNTGCSYDRFVATGAVRQAVVDWSVQVYNFETGLHLSYDEALDISDHYPIQMQIN